MTSSAFWRVTANTFAKVSGDGSSAPPDGFAINSDIVRKIRAGNGLLLGDFDESQNCAVVSFLGVVTEVIKEKSLVQVRWREKRLVLRPHANGAVHWKRERTFNFAREVSERYLLNSIFAEEFQTVNWNSEFGPSKSQTIKQKSKKFQSQTTKAGSQEPNNIGLITTDLASSFSATKIAAFAQEPEWVLKKRMTFPKSGFVYLIQTINGFKFQPSKSLPKWSMFFQLNVRNDVKLVHVAWFPDYIFAESDLQARFHKNRYDGELLRLSEDEIRQVKTLGELIHCDLLD